jgi:hypothetical protein
MDAPRPAVLNSCLRSRWWPELPAADYHRFLGPSPLAEATKPRSSRISAEAVTPDEMEKAIEDVFFGIRESAVEPEVEESDDIIDVTCQREGNCEGDVSCLCRAAHSIRHADRLRQAHAC